MHKIPQNGHTDAHLHTYTQITDALLKLSICSLIITVWQRKKKMTGRCE